MISISDIYFFVARVVTTIFTTVFFVFFLLVLARSAPLYAQQTSSSSTYKGLVLKNKVPVNTDKLSLKFPKVEEYNFDNGLTVLLLEDHVLPSFDISMLISEGSFRDPQGLVGLSSIVADLLKEGTKNYSSLQVSEKLEQLGLSFSSTSSVGSNSTVIRMSGLSFYIKESLDLFSEIILNPNFPEGEIKTYQERLVAYLQQQRAIPSVLSAEKLRAILYTDDSPARYLLPELSCIKNLTREDLISFHQKYYLPNKAIIAISGDFSKTNIIPMLKERFGEWKSRQINDYKISDVKQKEEKSIHLLDLEGSVQTGLSLGNIGLTPSSKDYIPVLVMNQIFGEGESSRLFIKLREEKGYTYGAYNRFVFDTFPSPWRAKAEVRTEVTEAALKDFIAEFKKITTEHVSNEELENAKKTISSSIALAFDNPNEITSRAIFLKRHNLPSNFWDTFIDNISKVSVSDVKNVALKYLNPDKLQIIAVGDAVKIRDILIKLGNVSEYSKDGLLKKKLP